MIPELLQALGLQQGQTERADLFVCPVCNEPDLVINALGAWRCFTCEKRGLPFQLVKHIKPEMRPAEAFALLEAAGIQDTGWAGPKKDDIMPKRTTVANHHVILSPVIDMFIDYHMDFDEDKATVTAFRIGEFIKWAFNDKTTTEAFKKISPKPKIEKVPGTIQDLAEKAGVR